MGRFTALLVQSRICRTFDEANAFLWTDFVDLLGCWQHYGWPEHVSLAALAGHRSPDWTVGPMTMTDGRTVTAEMGPELLARARNKKRS